MTWPPVPNTWEFELMKSVFSASVAVITLGLTWIVGQRLTSRWAVWQKRREIELATVTAFYNLYGDVVTLWRKWRQAYVELSPDERSAARRELMTVATETEGKLEAIFMKLASERVLDDEEARSLGLFRQAYRSVRLHVLRDLPIYWDGDSPEYKAMKELACEVSAMIHGSGNARLPTPKEAGMALVKITSVSELEWQELVAPDTRRFRLIGPSHRLVYLECGNG